MRGLRIGMGIGSLLVAAATVFAAAQPAPPSGVLTFSGVYDVTTTMRVADLTIPGGHANVGYTADVFVMPNIQAGSLDCGFTDTSGRLDFFMATRTRASPGSWTRIAFDADYDLPELTLGLRCVPNRPGPITVLIRDPQLHATGLG